MVSHDVRGDRNVSVRAGSADNLISALPRLLPCQTHFSPSLG